MGNFNSDVERDGERELCIQAVDGNVTDAYGASWSWVTDC